MYRLIMYTSLVIVATITVLVQVNTQLEQMIFINQSISQDFVDVPALQDRHLNTGEFFARRQ